MTPEEFSVERRKEAAQILQWMMGTVIKQPYHGQFLTAVQMPAFIEGAPRDATCAYYGQAIGAACAAWGAETMEQSAEEEDNLEAPPELLLIGATMPASNVMGAAVQEREMIEACAEIIRVILAGAIISAKEDFGGSAPYAIFRAMPDFVVRTDLTDGAITVMGRAMVKVLRADRLGVSYVLGNRVNEPVRELEWNIPLVELFYGPRRIRWLDRRSPGHLQHEQLDKVVG